MNDPPRTAANRDIAPGVALESVLNTDQLKARPSRPPDYEAENRALLALARHMGDSPRTILQKLAEVALESCRAGSAGVSLVSKERGNFYWPAIAGAWKPHIGGGTPRDFGPCGIVLDRDAVQLFTHPERYYPYLAPIAPPIHEALLTPFHVEGKAVGTVWVVTHDEARTFDAEDQRLIENLGRFAAAAYQAWTSFDVQQHQAEELRDVNEALLVSLVRQHELTEQAERARLDLRESDQRYRTLVDQVKDYAIFRTDPRGRATTWNQGVKRVLGFEEAEFIGQDLVSAIFTPEDVRSGAAQKELETAAAHGTASDDRWMRRKDGTHFFAAGVTTALRDEAARLIGFTKVMRDQTEKKRAEEALALLAAIVASSEDAIVSKDLDGVITSWNRGAERLFGYAAEEVLGKPGTLLIPPDQLDEEPRILECIRRGDVVEHYETVRRKKDGSLVDISLTVSPLRDAAGRIIGASKIARDITERSRLEQQTRQQAAELSDLHRRKDEFLAILSHELRNPLAPIANAVQMLRLQQGRESQIEQQARTIIERQVGQLKHLVDDLLEVSRITTGRVQLRQEWIAVSGIMERAVETARPLLEQRQHELTVALPSQTVWLYADAARLEQVVVNLLANAAKYTEEGGHVWLSVEIEGVKDEGSGLSEAACSSPTPDPSPLTPSWVMLRVRDTGVGIAPELLPRIFDLFTQADRSLDRSQGGLGIGLCLVQRLVQLHGGTVEVSSALGQGSEFVVRLPLGKEEGGSRKEATDPADSSLHSAPASLRVLVVDDNVDAAGSLATLLRASEYDVRTAHDGPSALEAALDYRPDVVLLDIGLPGLNGFEVAKRMRQQSVLPNVVLIAMTGYGQETDRQRSREAGFNHHLVKPADFEKVQHILTALADKTT